MTFELGTNDINKAYLGTAEIKKAQLGSVSVFDTTAPPATGNEGTQIFVMNRAGASTDFLHQYSLSTAYDLTTISYDNKHLDASSETNQVRGVSITSGGTRVFVVDNTTDTVYQYNLTTPWDASTASYASKSLPIWSETGVPHDMNISADGTKMFIAGAGASSTVKIWQYSFSTASDVSTASYDSKVFDVTAQVTGRAPTIFIDASGTRLYVCDTGAANGYVYQYTMSTAFDISTASYDSKSLNISTNSTTASGLSLSLDGTKMFVLDFTSDYIFQYTLSTPWDVSTGSYDSVYFSANPQGWQMDAMFIRHE